MKVLNTKKRIYAGALRSLKEQLWGILSFYARIKRKLSNKIVIHVYTICWNEEFFLPYFLRHYCAIARRVFVYDNMSTDRSRQIIRMFPNTTIIDFDSNDEIRDDLYLKIKNHAWKKSRGTADWVIIVDVDEILYNQNLIERLTEYKEKGITILPTQRVEMFSESLPRSSGMIYDEIKFGVLLQRSKACIFNPNAIFQINYEVGCHAAAPTGIVRFDGAKDLKLLHYKYLSLDHLLERHRAYRKRMSEKNKEHGWGIHYLEEYEQKCVERFMSLRQGATNAVDA